jgi:hypothetical protein
MISLIVTLIVLGVCLWAVESLVPLDPVIKQIIRVVLVLVVLLYIVRFFGLL